MFCSRRFNLSYDRGHLLLVKGVKHGPRNFSFLPVESLSSLYPRGGEGFIYFIVRYNNDNQIGEIV